MYWQKRKFTGGKVEAKKRQRMLLLAEAARGGCTISEAATYAGIHYATLSRMLKNDYFKAWFNGLRSSPNINAKFTLAIALEKKDDPELALKYLKSRAPDEFSEKLKTEHSGNLTLGQLIEQAAKKEQETTV